MCIIFAFCALCRKYSDLWIDINRMCPIARCTCAQCYYTQNTMHAFSSAPARPFSSFLAVLHIFGICTDQLNGQCRHRHTASGRYKNMWAVQCSWVPWNCQSFGAKLINLYYIPCMHRHHIKPSYMQRVTFWFSMATNLPFQRTLINSLSLYFI